MPEQEVQVCCCCRAAYRLKSLRRVRHSYGKRAIYAYICAPCVNNVAHAMTMEEENK